MKQNMLEKIRKLKPGEIVPLHYDEAFKIVFANPDHLEILTVLLSRILKIEYKDIVGRISLKPLKIPGQKLGEKKTERDVVVSLKKNDVYNLILEVNVSREYYQTIMNRNLYYSFQIAGRGLKESKNYKDMDYTFLINFNTFFVDKQNEFIFDEYLLRNVKGHVLTEKHKVFNINIAKCHEIWYHNKYQGMFEPYEEDLMLLCAAMMVTTEKDFQEIMELVRIKPEIKELMEALVLNMTKDDGIVGRYYDYQEEQRRINDFIIEEITEKATKEALEKGIQQGIEQGIQQGIVRNQKEVIIKMYSKNLSLEEIEELTGIELEVIKSIINQNN